MAESPNFSLADVTLGTSKGDHSKAIMKKFHWAIKRVSKEHNSNKKDPSMTQEELIELIRSWEPKRDIICLYVRWARQLKRNFNLDSIATLLCLSRQCGYTPINFLRKVKTLSVHKNEKATYGVSFRFQIPERNDIDKKRLNKEFLGLSVTLALLQEQVTDSPSILGKTGMRQSGPRTSYPMGIPLDSNKSADHRPTIVSHPTTEFHTQASLLNRIWISINHRWLALYLTEHLFRETNAPWSYQDALVYTFQMMAPCGPCRFEFLSPLAGYCFRFPTQESIELKRSQFRQIWNDPSSFLSYGNSCLTQFTTEAKSHLILECFQDLKADIPATCRKISYNRDAKWLRRWTILRAYIFHYWLLSTANKGTQKMVTTPLRSSNNQKKKNKRTMDPCSNDTSGEHANQLCHIPDCSRELKKKKPTPPNADATNGFLSITTSRRPVAVGHSLIPLATTNTHSSLKPSTPPGNWASPSGVTLKWAELRLISSQEMSSYVNSYLIIHRNDAIDLMAKLPPMEVYSANHLHDWPHLRLSGKPPFYPKDKVGPVTLSICSEADCFIDTPYKSFHTARELSVYFKEYGSLLPSMNRIQTLCQAIVTYGRVDTKRAPGQYRVNIGNGGQNWVNGSPCKLHGMQFQKDIQAAGNHNDDEILESIGQLTEFTWRVMNRMQEDASDPPIAPDTRRKQLYAQHLDRYLSMDEEVGFEDITLVVSSLYPVVHNVLEHKDVMNDTLAGYTRTAAFNIVLIHDNTDGEPCILLLQVICNFRKVIGSHVHPFHKYIGPVADHARLYLDKWQRSVHTVFAGRTAVVPTVMNRWEFYLDDSLPYSNVFISEEGKHKQSLHAEYLLMEVNPSRTLSLSMFIHSLVRLREHLKHDQIIELALACSFLSNPFWFDWTMSMLIQRLEDPHDSFEFGIHPFYDWAGTTIEIFGTWQGGPYNRWSPCGGTKEMVLETFGAQTTATTIQRAHGEQKLCQVIGILCRHAQWINSLSACDQLPTVDMPLSVMKAQSAKVIDAISQIASCQFSHFRLGILTTILAGSGILKEGRHLRQLMYPVKGSASYKHLASPIADYMSAQRAEDLLGDNGINVPVTNDGSGSVSEDLHDEFMQLLSCELGFSVYLRDEIECILCESHPMRSLNCRDWFRKGISIFDCNENGEVFRREYGRNTTWVKLQPPSQFEFAYVGKTTIDYIPVDAMLSYLATDLGKELRLETSRDIKFKGRNSRTSSHQRSYTNMYNGIDTFHRPSMKMADFYCGSNNTRKGIRSMFVLGDSDHAVDLENCNNLEGFQHGNNLYKYLLTLPLSGNLSPLPMAAACYHMDSELNSDQVTFFPGHIDKNFVHTAWFVPIGMSSFFTVISVTGNSTVTQDTESFIAFTQWKERLSGPESRTVDAFLYDFDNQARRYSGDTTHVRLIYLCKPGSVLSFPASQCYHATIVPKKPIGYPRDLLVFHPFDGIK